MQYREVTTFYSKPKEATWMVCLFYCTLHISCLSSSATPGGSLMGLVPTYLRLHFFYTKRQSAALPVCHTSLSLKLLNLWSNNTTGEGHEPQHRFCHLFANSLWLTACARQLWPLFATTTTNRCILSWPTWMDGGCDFIAFRYGRT